MTLSNAYKIDLEVFEGPLDLLLHLIRKSDVDIFNIPIAMILDQYLEHLGLMEELNIDMAGDFLLLASELAHIKSRLLLPEQEAANDGEEEVGDPREKLIQRLLEYQRYKDAAETLLQRPMLGRDVFESTLLFEEPVEEEAALQVDVFQLITCFSELLRQAPKITAHPVYVERVSVTERIYEIMAMMQSKEMTEFTSLFVGQGTREQKIVTFLAILEMARLKMLKVTQTEARGEIYLAPNFENVAVQDLAGQVTLQ